MLKIIRRKICPKLKTVKILVFFTSSDGERLLFTYIELLDGGRGDLLRRVKLSRKKFHYNEKVRKKR